MLSQIPADGFLAELSLDDQAILRGDSRGEMFAFCEGLNRYGIQLLAELHARRSERLELYGVLFYLKALNSFQGALLLLSRGMSVESEILSRTALECAIVLGAIAADPSYIDTLEAAHRVHEQKQARAIRDLLRGDTAGSFGPEIAKAIDEAASLRARDEHAVAAAAVKAGLRAEYEIFYRGASGAAAHATVGAVSQLLRAQGGVLRIHIGPDYDKVPRAFAVLAISLPASLRFVGRIFRREDALQAGEDFQNRWNEIIRPFDEQARR
ncbi:hypothetical protein GCM10028796_04850 [Ramlibacter monticola]|nr:DUF5677 domain-containing protein [Ramlibacter monticola]